jgi:hypothetical protein
VFPLAISLPSAASAGPSPLFDSFSGTLDVSDFSSALGGGITRGQNDSPFPFCIELSSTISSQLLLAH